MNDNTQAADAWKGMEENPERYEAAPDVEGEPEPVDRNEGSVSTDLGSQSITSLMSKV